MSLYSERPPPASLPVLLPVPTTHSHSYRAELELGVTISSPLRTDWVWLRPHRPAQPQPFLLYFNSVCGDSAALLPPRPPPGPHLTVTPSLLAEHLRVYAAPGTNIRIVEPENVSSIGLYISTVTSSTARDQWEEAAQTITVTSTFLLMEHPIETR